MVEAMETLTSVMALAAAGGAVALVVARLVAGRSPVVSAWGRRVVAWRNPLTLSVAGAATLGSLYFSEIADFVPCRLCWFQRVCMYPIAVIALVGTVRRDPAARWYAVPLAAVGACVSTYHYLIEQGVLADSDSCGAFGPPCAVPWFWRFGFVTLAFMALCGFAAILAVNLVSFPESDDPTRGSIPRPLEDPS